MHYELCILLSEVLADIKSAAWLESELHSDLDRHRRHQMADICEEGNIERVWRVLGVSVAEIRFALQKILSSQKHMSPVNDLEHPEYWRFRFLYRLPKSTVSFIKEKIHEYLVASVMADRTAVIIPEAAGVWNLRVSAALEALQGAAAASRRDISPVRRPLWPL